MRVERSASGQNDATVEFIASGVPPVGYRTYYLNRVSRPVTKGEPLTSNPNVAENDLYKIELVPGGIKSIYDKELGRELLNTAKFLGAEVFVMQSDGLATFNEFEPAHPTMQDFEKISSYKPDWQFVQCDGLASSYRLEQLMAHANFRITMTLYHRVKRIDFDVDMLGHDGTPYREYRMAFPLNMATGRVAYDTPFAAVEVGKDEIAGTVGGFENQTLAKDISPRVVQDWINASDGAVGVTMSGSVAVYDFADPTDEPYSQVNLQPMLLSTRKSFHGQGNVYLQEGDHHFYLSLTSDRPGWRAGYHWGAEMQYPLIAEEAGAGNGNKSLPAKQSFCQVEPANVIFEHAEKMRRRKRFDGARL